MATRTKKQQTETVVETEQTEEATLVQTETVEQPQGVVSMRAALRAQGFKVCPTHDKYFARLPQAAQAPVEGQTDPAIRPLSEFTNNIAACKACASLRARDKRSEHRDAEGKAPNSVQRLVNLMHREDEILAKAKALRATMTEDELDSAEALYHTTTAAD